MVLSRDDTMMIAFELESLGSIRTVQNWDKSKDKRITMTSTFT